MTHAAQPRLAVVITCYNYAAFVVEAINSVLGQAQDVEIVVVDDCSTDNSRDIIAGFGEKVTPVFQAVNQGQGAAFNAGFAATKSNSELVMFLDADDFLLPGAIAMMRANYDPASYMYHYRMRYADKTGALGGIYPPLQSPLADGDLSEKLRTSGRYNGQVTSGLVYNRHALEKVMPMDAEAFRQGGDGYLSAVVPLYGPCKSFDETLSAYRLHGMQHSKFKTDYSKRARWCLGHDRERYRAIREHSQKLGLTVSDNLEQRDPGHLNERIISLMFAPDLHPFEADQLSTLVGHMKTLPQGGGAFWRVFPLLPRPLKRQLMTWKIDPNARPAFLASLGRFLRRRFGIILN